MTLAFISPVVSLFLIPMLIAPPGWAQTSGPSGSALSNALQLKVLGGDNTPVPVGSRSNKGFYIEVTDENGTAVNEAAIALRLPDSGASGVFADGSHSAVVYTDGSGKAHIEGIQWNANPGLVTMRITATKGDQHAGILVEENLVATAPKAETGAPRLQAATPGTGVASTRASSSSTESEDAPLNSIATPSEAVPVRPAIRAAALGSNAPILRSAEPSVSISSDGSGPAYHGSFNKKKWIMIGLAIAAGAGAAYAASSLMKGSSSGSTSSSISIGAPTVSVGHP